jgi:glyoxylase-like metal-dependent hydrolase (beta-lactamase superfamily II)
VLLGERRHVLIDPGHVNNEFGECCFDYLASAIESDGFKVDDVGLIVNTHSHPDHCEANELVVARSGALVTMSEEEDEFRNTLGRKLYSMLRARIPEFVPFFYLKEGNLNFGNGVVNLQIFNAPGHSPGSVCLYWPQQKILITGDVIFNGSIGRTDFPSGSLSQLMQSIDRLSGLDVEYLVPGHSTELGSIIAGKQSVERNFQMVKLMF